MAYKEITAEEATKRISSDKFMKEWYLLATKNGDKLNFMTGSCAAVGNIWMKPVMLIFIRQQRYTTKNLRETGEFVATFVQNKQKELEYLGANSGRNVDKVANCGLTLEYIDSETPTVKEGHLVVKCKVIYRQHMKKYAFMDKDIIKDWYPADDYSVMYIAEILNAYEKIEENNDINENWLCL